MGATAERPTGIDRQHDVVGADPRRGPLPGRHDHEAATGAPRSGELAPAVEVGIAVDRLHHDGGQAADRVGDGRSLLDGHAGPQLDEVVTRARAFLDTGHAGAPEQPGHQVGVVGPDPGHDRDPGTLRGGHSLPYAAASAWRQASQTG